MKYPQIEPGMSATELLVHAAYDKRLPPGAVRLLIPLLLSDTKGKKTLAQNIGAVGTVSWRQQLTELGYIQPQAFTKRDSAHGHQVEHTQGCSCEIHAAA
jgi:hypothetical protein